MHSLAFVPSELRLLILALTHSDYTSASRAHISLVVKLNSNVMDTIYTEFGIEYIRWTDEQGNIWSARLDEVELYGKECFECMPGPDDFTSGWEVTFKQDEEDDFNEDDFIMKEEDWKADKSLQSWLRDQEIM